MDIGKYTAKKIIAYGFQARIYTGINKEDNSPVVVKLFNVNAKSASELADICEEIEILQKLSSKYIVRYIDNETRALGQITYRAIILEDLTSWLTLDKYLLSTNRTSSKDFNTLALNLLRGLHYIHENGITHRDIKPENIMVDENFNIKYIDFGLSRPNTQGKAKGTPLYFPPEKVLTSKQDIWALGVVMYQIANPQRYPHNFPFDFDPDWKFSVFITELRKSPYKYPSAYYYEYGYTGVDFNYLIESMLEVDPELRPSCQTLLHLMDSS